VLDTWFSSWLWPIRICKRKIQFNRKSWPLVGRKKFLILSRM